MNWNDASATSGPVWGTRLLNVLTASGIKVCALAFVLEVDIWAHTVIKMMWCDTCDFFWETITASHVIVCCHSVNHSNTLNYCVDGSIWHFKFPKVVQAHTLGEVGNLIRHSFVKGFFRDNPYNFYWNRFIFDRQGAKNKLAQFFETRCMCFVGLFGWPALATWISRPISIIVLLCAIVVIVWAK